MICVSLNFDCFMWLLLGLILPEVPTFCWFYFTGGLPNKYIVQDIEKLIIALLPYFELNGIIITFCELCRNNYK